MNTTVHKAGGIVLRVVHGDVFVYMIHRHRYNDWSLPKGHIDEGEDERTAALREILEETGLHCRIIDSLPVYQYALPSGETSEVAMFACAMIAAGGDIDVSEVDYGKWMPMTEAIDQCSYPSLKEYMQRNQHAIEHMALRSM